jgi:CelD/BcsL family acetyltransferase involved in cellulose biosynthesis
VSELAIEILHPVELAAHDVAAWRALQDATPAFGSPLLGPEFAKTVGAVRKDARVAIWRNHDGAPAAFLAYHRRPNGFGRPIGAPFCDYHALIGGEGLGLDSHALLSAAKLNAFRLSGFLDPSDAFGSSGFTRESAYRIVLKAPPDEAKGHDAGLDHLNDLKSNSANRFKNFRRYSNRLERDFGPLRLVAQDLDQHAFQSLLDWKRQQLARTGLHDFLRPPWVGALMQQMFDAPCRQDTETGVRRFGGLMISLYAGDRHVAGHFGVRLAGWYHPWIAAMAPDLQAHGAGFVHQWKAVQAMGSLGLHTYDLGPGSDHWKRLFTSDVVEVKAGLITAPTLGGRLALAADRLWTAAPLDRVALAARLRNRLDQIAAIETGWLGRARGVAALASALERRSGSRRSEPVERDRVSLAVPARSPERQTS